MQKFELKSQIGVLLAALVKQSFWKSLMMKPIIIIFRDNIETFERIRFELIGPFKTNTNFVKSKNVLLKHILILL